MGQSESSFVESDSEISKFNDGYTFKKFLGEGGFGKVVLVSNNSNGKEVAIKIIELFQ
jgi:serine/threonine protein kinase